MAKKIYSVSIGSVSFDGRAKTDAAMYLRSSAVKNNFQRIKSSIERKKAATECRSNSAAQSAAE